MCTRFKKVNDSKNVKLINMTFWVEINIFQSFSLEMHKEKDDFFHDIAKILMAPWILNLMKLNFG